MAKVNLEYDNVGESLTIYTKGEGYTEESTVKVPRNELHKHVKDLKPEGVVITDYICNLEFSGEIYEDGIVRVELIKDIMDVLGKHV